MPNVNFKVLADLGAAERADLLKRSETDLSGFLDKVRPIIEAVRTEGDAALVRFARDFDKATGLEPGSLKATEAEFDEAFGQVDPAVIEAIRFGIENIRTFHEEQAPEPMFLKELRPGAYAGDRFTPIRSVALYVPRGKGSFPSVALMTAIPAVVAKVPRVVILTPPAADGRCDPATLVAAKVAGVTEVYRCGGAQAVAAAAYGTQTVPRCVKIVGPGSPYLVAAKKLLADVIDPGILAGPSESIVFADDTADGRLAALDLLVEAEHGPDSSCFLVTTSRKVAEDAVAAIPGFWKQMSATRVDYSAEVLSGERGGVVLAPDLDAAYAFINDYAAEHLMIQSDEPFAHLHKIKHAGEILLGNRTSNTLANFVIGPNNVLPTNGAARTMSPLSVHDFGKRSTVAHVTSVGYAELAKHARILATYEGFDGHANAVSETRHRLMGN